MNTPLPTLAQLSPVARALVERSKSVKTGNEKDMTRALASFVRPAAVNFAESTITLAAVRGMNQKAAMRTAQACDFTVSGDRKSCDSVTAALVALVVLSTQKHVTFNDAHIVAGASKDGAAVAGVSRAKLARFLPRTSNLRTITSKTSRTVGEHGFLTALGVTVKGDKHGFDLVNPSHPFILAYAGALEKMTDQTFALLQKDGNK